MSSSPKSRGKRSRRARSAPAAGGLDLADILPGVWIGQIQAPVGPGQATFEIMTNGEFRGEMVSALGHRAVEGRWQVNPFTRQVDLQGRQLGGGQTTPYAATLRVTAFDREQIRGVASGGAPTHWQRVAPPAA